VGQVWATELWHEGDPGDHEPVCLPLSKAWQAFKRVRLALLIFACSCLQLQSCVAALHGTRLPLHKVAVTDWRHSTPEGGSQRTAAWIVCPCAM
jgi:hypothetical protein